MVFIMNFLLLLWDIYLFVSVGSTLTVASRSIYSVIFGAINAGNSLVYLILIPMMIAKVTQERYGQEGQKSCFAGTLIGTMLAVSLTGQYLISQNIAILFAFLTAKTSSAAWDDIIVIVLIFAANLILWSPIKAELRQVEWIKRRYYKEKVDDEWEINDLTEKEIPT